MNSASILLLAMILDKLRAHSVAALLAVSVAFTLAGIGILIAIGGHTGTHSPLAATAIICLVFACNFSCATFLAYCDARRLEQRRCMRTVRS